MTLLCWLPIFLLSTCAALATFPVPALDIKLEVNKLAFAQSFEVEV
jgi:hypothetical protein